MRFDARQIAGLCNGSTPDSDSVCEGSNPSPAAKNRLSIGQPVFLRFCIFQTVKELSSQKLRREEKCERKPSGFPFASNNPPQRQNCKIMLQNLILQFGKQLVKGVQRGRGKLAAPGRITGCPQRIRNSFAHRPGGIPAGTFSIYRTAYY